MKKNPKSFLSKALAVALTVLMLVAAGVLVVAATETSEIQSSGTWGGVDWTLTTDGTLTIAPTVNEITKTKPYSETNPKELYQVGEVPAAVNDAISAITGWPFNRAAVKKLVIEEGVTSIGSFALQGLSNLTGEVVIPSTVTYIGQEAFQNSKMTKLTFAKGGTGELCIGPGAFKKIAAEEVVFPEDRSEIHIHCWAFNDCTSLKYVTLPANVTTFSSWTHVEYCGMNFNNGNDSQVFARCWALEKLTFGSEEVQTQFKNAAGNTSNINAIKASNPNFEGYEVKVPYVAQIGENKYTTLKEAVEAATPGATIVLLDNVTLTGGYADTTEGLRIEKAITIDGNNYTIDCGNFNKGIRIYNEESGIARVMIKNVTIVNNTYNGRCIDTRTKNIYLDIQYVTLRATNGNSQPLTIGGSDPAYRVNLGATTIDAGVAGYGVIAFVPVQVNVTAASNTKISGFAAFYMKADKTKLNLGHGTYIGTNAHAKESGDFGTIVLEGKNCTVTLQNHSVVKAVATVGAAHAAILMRNVNNTLIVEDGAQIVVEGKYATRVETHKYEVDVPVSVESQDKNFYATYSTLGEAVAAAPAGATVTLYQDVTLTGGYTDTTEGLRIEKAITINGNNHTIDCGNFNKGIRIYNEESGIARVIIKNVTIVNNTYNGRCIDTRTKNIYLDIQYVTLRATNGNSQPLTIGGSDPAYRVSLGATTIDAGVAGYGVIAFVPVQAGISTSSNTQISGLAAFYIKSEGSNFNLNLGHGTYVGTNNHSAESGMFGAVVLEGNNCTVRLTIDAATLRAVANAGAVQAAFLVRGSNNKIDILATNAKVETEGNNAFWALVDADVASTTTIQSNGVVMPLVAECDGYHLLSFEDALRFADINDCNTIKLLADTDYNFELSKEFVLDLNGYDYIGTITLNKGATLTAPEGLNVQTQLAGYIVNYSNDGKYQAVTNFVVTHENMRFGNTLSLLFAVPKYEEFGEGCYVVITHTYLNEEKELVTATKTIKFNAWDGDVLSGYYVVESDGFAAKQMTDTVTVTFYNASNVALGKTFTSSIQDYADRVLDSNDLSDFHKVVIAMLNYGTAAQKYFDNYNGDKLANSILSGDQLLLTEFAGVADPRNVEGAPEDVVLFTASGVRFNDSINLIFQFKGISEEAAEELTVEFTANDKVIKITELAWVEEDQAWAVELDELNIADAYDIITCKIKRGDQTLTITDSVAGYVTRRLAAVEAGSAAANLYTAFMNFADAAGAKPAN